MSRNDNFRRGNKNRNWNNRNNNQTTGKDNHNRNNNGRQNGNERRPVMTAEMQKAIEENESAIREFKANITKCEICGEPINELASAINNRSSGNPVHFDCVLNQLTESEKPGPNDKVTYIGNGKFAVLHFENVHDMRHFSIVKEIEWESRESERGAWRDTMAGLYSQVK